MSCDQVRGARQICDYVIAAEQAGLVYLPSELEIATVQEWLDWTKSHADEIDPFTA